MSGVVAQVESYPQFHPMRLTRLHHVHGLCHTDRHRLLDQHVFPRVRCSYGVGRVEEVGGGDPDHVHAGIGEEGLQRRVGSVCPMCGRKRFGTRVVSAIDRDQLRPLCPGNGRSEEGLGMAS